MIDRLKPIILLTFPRTGASRIVGYCSEMLSLNKRFNLVPDELTHCQQEELLPRLSLLNERLKDREIFATKLHIHKFMHLDYPQITRMIDWVNLNTNNYHFLILNRLNTLELCLSYLRAQHTGIWGPEVRLYSETSIVVPKIAVEKFNQEMRFFNSICSEFDASIRRISYERVFETKEDNDMLKKLTLIDFKQIGANGRYKNGTKDYFSNLNQIKEWLDGGLST